MVETDWVDIAKAGLFDVSQIRQTADGLYLLLYHAPTETELEIPGVFDNHAHPNITSQYLRFGYWKGSRK